MAFSTVETVIANPAKGKRRKGKKMAKRMTLKQRLHFGTARQRAAAKSSLRGKRKKNTAHRKRTVARKRVNPAPRKKSRARTRTARRRNIGEIISLTLGNPAGKKGSKMARTKRTRRRASSRKANAGTRRRTRRMSNPARRHSRRRNPSSSGMLTKMVALGGGAVIGSSGSGMLTSAVLGASNTGFMGYAGNLVATLALAWAAHSFVKSPDLSAGVLAGGVGALIRRIIGDTSALGQLGQQLGMGDYLQSNFVTPAWLPDARKSAMSANGFFPGAPALPPVNSGGAAAAGMGHTDNLW